MKLAEVFFYCHLLVFYFIFFILCLCIFLPVNSALLACFCFVKLGKRFLGAM